MNKGQIMSTDLVFAVVMFFLVVSVISLHWENTLVRINEVERRTEIEARSHLVSNFLTKTSGYPIGWTCANVYVIGLAREQNTVSSVRFNEFVNCTDNNATMVKERLGVADYGLFVNLTRANGAEWNHTGEHIPANATLVSTALSYVLYNNEMSKLYVSLWK